MHCFAALTPVTFLERAAAAFPRAAALQGPRGTLTYAQLRARARKLMTVLRQLGVCHGDRVALLSENAPEVIEAHYGIPAAGGVIVSINPWLPTEEIAHQLQFSGCRVVLAQHACFERHMRALVRPGAPRHTLVFETDHQCSAFSGAADYEEVLLDTPEQAPLDALITSEMAPITLNFTSGTTGRAKGVLMSHRGAYLHALGQVMMLGLNRDTNYLWTLPMFHVSGWGHMWANAVMGARQIVSKVPEESVEEEARFAAQFREYKVSHLAGSPRLVRRLAAMPDMHGALRGTTIVTGGAAPTGALVTQLEAEGARLIHQYGLSETSGPFVVCEEQPEWQHEGAEARAALRCRQGVVAAHAGTGLRVVGADGHVVAADGRSPGEVQMSGNTVALGYFQNHEATAKSFVEGWFRTGDMAVVHPDGYLEIVDRIKDLIFVETKYGWENISSIEIENVLAGFPSVRDSAVVGLRISDTEEGATLVAFIDQQPDTVLSVEDLHEFVQASLPSHKQPAHFVLAPIPKTVTGKTRKDLLLEQASRQLGLSAAQR